MEIAQESDKRTELLTKLNIRNKLIQDVAPLVLNKPSEMTPEHRNACSQLKLVCEDVEKILQELKGFIPVFPEVV
jgi:hypothetical protein